MPQTPLTEDHPEACPDCEGTCGIIEKCQTCDGTGRMSPEGQADYWHRQANASYLEVQVLNCRVKELEATLKAIADTGAGCRTLCGNCTPSCRNYVIGLSANAAKKGDGE